MLQFIRNLFRREREAEKIPLNEVNKWLEKKEEPYFESLKTGVNELIMSINEGKEKAIRNVEILGNAELQNPNIPNKAKTVMEGNRDLFIKKLRLFFSNIDVVYTSNSEVISRCKNLINEVDSLAKSTARNYAILNEFFAREVAVISENIKKIETNTKDIINLIENDNSTKIKKIRNDVNDLQSKIIIKERLGKELENKEKVLENYKKLLAGMEKSIADIKASGDYKDYEKLLVERENVERALKDIEHKLFHDFSEIGKAMRKYSKIAFEDEKLIESYLDDSIGSLIEDNDLKILKVLGNLKKLLGENKLELEQKKSERTSSKINKLSMDYLSSHQKAYRELREKLTNVIKSIDNNKIKDELSKKNNEADDLKVKIEKQNEGILKIKNDFEKIDVENIKKDIQNIINNTLEEKVILV